jgi:hypothetical protein
MAVEIDFISASDKPAMLAISDAALEETAKTALRELGYKTHTAKDLEDFAARFGQVQYQVLIIDEHFACAEFSQNLTLQKVQWMPMPQRRHCTIFLISSTLNTLNAKQGFQHSVHAIVNRADLSSLKQIVQQVVADNDMFLNVYRDTQVRIAQGK